jgi:hypothetical protein
MTPKLLHSLLSESSFFLLFYCSFLSLDTNGCLVCFGLLLLLAFQAFTSDFLQRRALSTLAICMGGHVCEPGFLFNSNPKLHKHHSIVTYLSNRLSLAGMET